jgi:L-arabinose isomerase
MDSGNISDKVPGRVAVLMPYWSFWETSVPWDLRADREALRAEATAIIGRMCEVTVSRTLAGESPTESPLPELHDVDAVVVLSTMAAPSATCMVALDSIPTTPVIVWALSRSSTLAAGFSHTDITTAGSSVGGPMVTSALARAGRPFDVVATSLAEPDDALRAIRCAISAGRLLRGPLLAVGDPIPGYTTVVPPPSTDTFLKRIHVPSSSLAELAAQVSPDEVRRTMDEVRAEFDVDPRVTELSLERAARAEVALRVLVHRDDAIAGTINCHEANLRGKAAFGIAPCLALGRLTSAGTPFTCTGDVLTAYAMAAIHGLGLPTLYHEVEALDFETDEVVLANSGEHDLGLCGRRPALVPNIWYTHDKVVGPCALYSIPEGPASLVAFVMAPEPRFVVAEGFFTGREYSDTGVPNAGFRFGELLLGQAWADWARAGVTHHSAATPAHVADDIRSIARLVGAEFVRIN